MHDLGYDLASKARRVDASRLPRTRCRLPRGGSKGADDEYVAVLPLSWVMEQMYSVGWNLIARMKVNFPEEQATVMADLREIGPTFLLLAPRVWEQIAADVRARMMDSSAWKQAIYKWESCAESRPSARESAPGSRTSCCSRHCATG